MGTCCSAWRGTLLATILLLVWGLGSWAGAADEPAAGAPAGEQAASSEPSAAATPTVESAAAATGCGVSRDDGQHRDAQSTHEGDRIG